MATLEAVGAANIGTTLSVAGALSVDGAANMGTLEAVGAANMGATLSVNGAANMGTLEAVGAANMGATLSVAGAANFQEEVNVTGMLSAGNASVDGTLIVGGALRAASFSTGGNGDEGSLATDTLRVAKNATVVGSLHTSGLETSSLGVSGSMSCDVDPDARIELCSESDGKNR